MDLHIDDVKLQGRLLLVTASGSFELDAALRLLKQVCDTAKEKEVNKILVNCLAMDGELPTFERYHLGATIAEYIKQRRMNPRLAIVGKPPTIDGFAVRVAQNRDLVTKMFSNPQEAMGWLEGWPD